MNAVEKVFAKAIENGRIKSVTPDVDSLSFKVLFNDGVARRLPEALTAEAFQVSQWLEAMEWGISLHQFTMVKEVLKRKAIKKYGLIAKEWFN